MTPCATQPHLYPQFVIHERGDVLKVEIFIIATCLIQSGFLYDENGHPSGDCLIAGEAAEWLYTALTGQRFFHDGTDDASPDLARAARAHLAAIGPWDGGYWVAHRVVEYWGEVIVPELKTGGRRILL